MSGSAHRPRGVEAAILALDCTPEVRARLLAKLERCRVTMQSAIEAARVRRLEPCQPGGWIPIDDVSQRVREAAESARDAPAMTVEEALGMLEAFDSTKH